MLQFCHAERYYIDPFIVRGLDYYTGTVFETFFDDFMSR
jgi:histidyl-tRNA synthetase